MSEKIKTHRIAIPVLSQNVNNYISAIESFGSEAVAVETPVSSEDFDALVLPGGVDIDPSRYHEENHGCINVKKELDEFQLGLLDSFVKAKKPILGVCRGLQLINVYFGGSLFQDIETAEMHWDAANSSDSIHASQAVQGSWIWKLYGTHFNINSFHHQAINKLGEGLEIVQKSTDGVVEGICHKTLPIYAVQWHPERMRGYFKRDAFVDGSLVFSYFLNNIS